MELLQFNSDLAIRLKKKIKVEAAKADVTHACILNAIMENFYRRYPNAEQRRAIFQSMKEKIDKNGEIEFSPLKPEPEPASLHSVELAEARGQ